MSAVDGWSCVIAVDIGGTQIRAALCDRDCRVRHRAVDLTPAREGPDAVMARIDQAIRQVWPTGLKDHVVTIGVSAPGPLDPWTGTVLRGQNISGWDNYPLGAIIQERFDTLTVVGDDANVAALAEQRLGAGQGKPNLIYLTLSTGVGSGIIVNDQLLLGAHGVAAEAGCMIVEPGGPICSCGSHRGCLEALISGPAIAREARKRVQDYDASLIVELVQGNREAITAETVNQAAQQGDQLATDIFRQAGVYLGIGLVNLLHILNPDIIIVGGSVSKVGNLILGPAREVIRECSLTDRYWRETPIVLAALGDDVALVGAACLAWDSVPSH